MNSWSKPLVFIVIPVSLEVSSALAESGLVIVQSNFSVHETGNRLDRQLEEKGMMIWQDESGAVWLSYNDPYYLAERHKLQGCDENIGIIAEALANLARAAAAD